MDSSVERLMVPTSFTALKYCLNLTLIRFSTRKDRGESIQNILIMLAEQPRSTGFLKNFMNRALLTLRLSRRCRSRSSSRWVQSINYGSGSKPGRFVKDAYLLHLVWTVKGICMPEHNMHLNPKVGLLDRKWAQSGFRLLCTYWRLRFITFSNFSKLLFLHLMLIKPR